MRLIVSTGIVGIAVGLALAIGWVVNIIKLFGIVNDPLTALTLLRAVGVVVAPLGGVLGYL